MPRRHQNKGKKEAAAAANYQLISFLRNLIHGKQTFLTLSTEEQASVMDMDKEVPEEDAKVKQQSIAVIDSSVF